MAFRNGTPEGATSWKEIDPTRFCSFIGRGLVPTVWFRGKMLGLIDGEFDPDHRKQQIKSLGERVLVHSVSGNHWDIDSFIESPPRHLR